MLKSVKDPKQYRVDEKLRNDEIVTIRAIRPDDKHALQEGIRRLGAQSVYFRFFQSKVELTEAELVFLTQIDFVSHVALGASVNKRGKDLAVGVGRYIVTDTRKKQRQAEVALVVDDTYQGLGIGTLLLQHLIRIARAGDIHVFTASLLAENKKMMAVFEHSGVPIKKWLDNGEFKISLNLASR